MSGAGRKLFPQSLRVQLLAGLLIPLAAIVFVNLTLARHNAGRMADLVLNHSLAVSAAAIADHVRASGHGIDVYIPPFALVQLSTQEPDITYYRVTGPHGELLAGYSDIPLPPIFERAGAPSFADVVYHGSRVRFAELRQVVFARNAALGAYIVVGETLRARDGMIRNLERQAAAQQTLLVLIAAGIAWLGLRRDLAPLVRLGREIRSRAPGDLAPLPTGAVHAELRPFVMALNEHLSRQRLQLDAQRRFAANAAHQLRTPLTLLRMQADYALRETETEKRSGALVALTTTTDQMTRLTKQLLRLSEAESQPAAARREAIDLRALVRDVLEGYTGLALANAIDLGFDGPVPGSVTTLGDPTMVRELVRNLVDNALRYVPAGGVVTVSVAADSRTCLLRVEDNGPGIPVAERALVFERFYRILANGGEGSGLGLAIVREIVDSGGGSVALSEPATGPGLVVEVRLPRAR